MPLATSENMKLMGMNLTRRFGNHETLLKEIKEEEDIYHVHGLEGSILLRHQFSPN